MARPRSVPAYRRHKSSGQAIVTLVDHLGDRRDVLLGKHGTAESRQRYAAVIAEWESAGRQLPAKHAAPDLTISELILRYWQHVEAYYVKQGAPTSEPSAIKGALRHLKQLYGRSAAKDFGPLSLKAVRDVMVKTPIVRKVKVTDPETGEVRIEEKVLREGWTRKNINKQVGRIKRMFAWSVEEELLPASVHAALERVAGLRKGKTTARETGRVKPVPEALVEAVLPLLPPVMADMVNVQRLTGARPSEILRMRPIDIDMTGTVWEYRPSRYKSEHHNEDGPDRERIIFIGPKAQAIIAARLSMNVSASIFDPAKAEEERNAKRREARKTKLWPSHVKAQNKKRAKRRRRGPKEAYGVAAYRRAIHRACEKAGIPSWSPHRLRHLRGTEVRKQYGLEGAQAVLGHAELGVTQVYAEVDRDTARRIMSEIG